jgi:hypothetical protein
LVYIYPFIIATLIFAVCIGIEIGRQKLFSKIMAVYSERKVAA